MESGKRNQQNTNKIKKTRNDLIRSSLGLYLKGRNYTSGEKFRKSEKTLTQTPFDMAISILIESELSRPNSFSYSNVFCLNNNPTQVDQQFSKLSTFVQSQRSPVKDELVQILPPLLCHLYIEMLKGRDWRPAFEFLKKYASLIAPIDSVNTVVGHKLNGSTMNTILNDDPQSLTNGNSQIVFLAENDPNDIPIDPGLRESFKGLIHTLSTMTRTQDIDGHPIVASFRSCKFQMKMSQKAINTLKNYLSKNGHVIILQIIQVWFHIEIDEANKMIFQSDDEDDDLDDDEVTVADDGVYEYDEPDFNIDVFMDDANLLDKNRESTQQRNQFKYEKKLEKDEPVKKKLGKIGDETELKILNEDRIEYSYEENYAKLVARDQLVECYEKLWTTTPQRILNIQSNHNRLCCANVDSSGCHLVAGFDDSVINLWTMKKSVCYGRKPYQKSADRGCEWSVENCDGASDSELNSSSSESDEPESNSSRKSVANRFRRKYDKKLKWKKFMEKKCSQNSISGSGGIALRGHGGPVTDVLLSNYNPLLYSVSKDMTMRAWKASDYTCGGIYRGHNYPIWCVAESSNGLYVATGSKDTTARLWSTDREFPQIVYVGHTQDVDAIAFHPNGSYIATGSSDLSVRLWCVTSGKLFRVFTDCKLPVQTIAFSPDGRFLAAAGEETKIRIFDLAGGSQLTELRDVTAPITSIAWNKHSSTFACCSSDGSFKIWNVSELGTTDDSKPPQPSTSSSSTTGTSSASHSSSSINSPLLLSNTTSCKRLIKLQYNNDNSISFIGNS